MPEDANGASSRISVTSTQLQNTSTILKNRMVLYAYAFQYFLATRSRPAIGATATYRPAICWRRVQAQA